MEPQVIERIFDPYFTTKGVGKGTGMGLSVVHSLVKNHGGTIDVSSRPGEGTNFRLRFPTVRQEAVSETESRDKPAPGRERILFVDDNASLVEVTRKTLERLGYRVEGATSPVEALQIFEDRPEAFDLVISDMSMPQMTGSQLTQRLLNLRPDLPVILCTGYSEMISRESAREIGIKEFVLKPFERQKMAALIRKVLDSR